MKYSIKNIRFERLLATLLMVILVLAITYKAGEANKTPNQLLTAVDPKQEIVFQPKFEVIKASSLMNKGAPCPQTDDSNCEQDNDVVVKMSAFVEQSNPSQKPHTALGATESTFSPTPITSPTPTSTNVSKSTLQDEKKDGGGVVNGATSVPTSSNPVDAGLDGSINVISTPTIFITDVEVRVFYNDEGHSNFLITTQTPPAFTQHVPVINFNPTAGVICTPGPINALTRPLTDAHYVPPCAGIKVQATTGAPFPTPTILQAGVGGLQGFSAVFLSTIYVDQAADLTFNIEFDDGFVWGIGPLNGSVGGPQPVFVHGQFDPEPPPAITPSPTQTISPTPWPTTTFRNYPVVSQSQFGYGHAPVIVRFPAAGYYPMEIDYTEDGLNGLNITLESTTQTPVSSGPSPTATATSYTPTAMPNYPWCVPSPSPTGAPDPSLFSPGYYVRATHTAVASPSATPNGWNGIWYDKGKEQAQSVFLGDTPWDGVVLMDFGKPWFLHYDPAFPDRDVWGTKLLVGDLGGAHPFSSWQDIRDAVTDFAQGFAYIAAQSPTSHLPHITIAIGVNNFVDTEPITLFTPTQFRRHGQHWGSLVNEIGNTLAPLQEMVSIEGAIDIEVGWSASEYPLRWTQGFEEMTTGFSNYPTHYYFSFSDCAGCYDGAISKDPDITYVSGDSGIYTLPELVALHYANRAGMPLPQVYFALPEWPGHANQPTQWSWLRSYAATHYISLDEYGIEGRVYGMAFFGITASIPNLNPGVAWQRLWQKIHAEGCSNPTLYNYISPIDYYP